MSQIAKEIKKLQKEKDVVILAHYYVPDEVQAVADLVGDSYYLADMATEVKEQNILLCGVSFMLESAKILNPDKTVIIPETEADCPMAHMVKVEDVLETRQKYPDAAVVCYVNSTAEIKACSDVCVTSSNALKIVKSLPNKQIYFIPDENLGRFVAAQCPDKEFIFNDGYCHVHAEITPEMLMETKRLHPNAKVLVHPECKPEIIELADYAGSTAGIIKMAGEYPEDELIIGTEKGISYELKKRYPNKTFYPAGKNQVCFNMKKITLDKVYNAIKNETDTVDMPGDLMDEARNALTRMLELSR